MKAKTKKSKMSWYVVYPTSNRKVFPEGEWTKELAERKIVHLIRGASNLKQAYRYAKYRVAKLPD